MANRSIIYRERADGLFDVFAEVYLETVKAPKGCETPLAPLEGKINKKAEVARQALSPGAPRIGDILSTSKMESALVGDGVNLLGEYGNPRIEFRVSDPRLYALVFSRNEGGLNGRGWTRAAAKEKALALVQTTSGKTKATELNVREVSTPKDGVTKDMLDANFVFRLTGPGRSPAGFEMDEPACDIDVPGKGGTFTGIAVLAYPRRGRRFEALPPLDDLCAMLEMVSQ